MEMDLNADLGEGADDDAALMALLTSANICCGHHAGSEAISRETIVLAKRAKLSIGAHPGYPDREQFGRREQQHSEDAYIDMALAQILDLIKYADDLQMTVKYVKPHGAWYNQACRDANMARPLVKVCASLSLPIVGLPGSQLERCAKEIGVPFFAEGFVDRRYRPDGSLVPRSEPNAHIEDPAEAIAQLDWLIRKRGVRTICIHGDSPHALAFATKVREAILAKGHILKAFV